MIKIQKEDFNLEEEIKAIQSKHSEILVEYLHLLDM